MINEYRDGVSIRRTNVYFYQYLVQKGKSIKREIRRVIQIETKTQRAEHACHTTCDDTTCSDATEARNIPAVRYNVPPNKR